MSERHWARSLRFRLLAATLVALLVALVLAGFLLSALFHDHVVRQFETGLAAQLDQVIALLEFDATDRPQINAQALTDPRWSRPYSGLYWQVDAGPGGPPQRGVLRSRSLWDAELVVPADEVADGRVHVHRTAGPGGENLLLMERTVRPAVAAGTPWRLLVAADLQETEAAIDHFNGTLAASLTVLLGLLCAAALAQVAVGLAPLRTLRRALAAVHAGRVQRLEGRFPNEVQPLIDDFNGVLDRNAEIVQRARTQAGNLAHAIKTPLAAMAQAAASAHDHAQSADELASLVQEQVEFARRHVDWHLARSRAAAAQGLPGARTVLAPVIAGLVRVLEKLYAERGAAIVCDPVDAGWAFAGEAQDLQEILGNVLDNACKWARSKVYVRVANVHDADGNLVRIVIEDDGPGIDAERREVVMSRGARLDESVPGSGLGLAIVQELVGLYAGSVTLGASSLGGLGVELMLPSAEDFSA